MEQSSQINKEIGERIREARLSKNMSQQDLATKANVSLPHISEIENGKQTMKLLTFVRIIEALQVSADAILRADVPCVNQIYQSELAEIISDQIPFQRLFLRMILLHVECRNIAH